MESLKTEVDSIPLQLNKTLLSSTEQYVELENSHNMTLTVGRDLIFASLSEISPKRPEIEEQVQVNYRV